MNRADELLDKDTLTRAEVIDVLKQRRREWELSGRPLVTVEVLRRLVAEYARAHWEFAGTTVTPAALQRLLATVFGAATLRAQPDLAEVYENPLAACAPVDGAQVLVIDDDQIMLSLISQLLRREGMNVVTAESGTEGILKFQRQNFDLVLLDYNMPNLNGPETCVRLREKMEEEGRLSGKPRRVPVVFLTAMTAKENVIEAVQAGGEGYIIKPFTPPELLDKVRKYLPAAPGSAR